jgi:site-specific DNA recombinase
MTTAIKRCAVYTRKSTDEGLEQQFNSLDAQREAGEAYILSQKANGWVCLTEHYDDGGFSGGNTNRPGLKKMLEDIRNGLIDIVVVYKIDRLSRSIYDFAALSKTFDQYGVAFCSVTQEINTTTSSGRMMLNILVTFAQYEREIIAERIRDKMAASKKKGKWVGGTVPFGYMVEDKLLVEEPKEAEIVRWIFHQYQHLVTAREIAAELNESNRLFRGNKQWNLRHVFRILKNRIYIGEIAYKGENYQGEHKPIIEKKQWDIVQSILSASDPDKRLRTQKQKTTAILKGIARCGHCGGALGPTYANNGFKRYLYYICNQDQRRPKSICPVRRVSAPAIEDIVLEQLRRVLQTKSAQEILIKMGFSQETVNGCAKDFDAIWDELFPRERQRIINLLLERVDVYVDHVDIEIKTNGLNAFAGELTNGKN